jgi:hypothetical protein
MLVKAMGLMGTLLTFFFFFWSASIIDLPVLEYCQLKRSRSVSTTMMLVKLAWV